MGWKRYKEESKRKKHERGFSVKDGAEMMLRLKIIS